MRKGGGAPEEWGALGTGRTPCLLRGGAQRHPSANRGRGLGRHNQPDCISMGPYL